MNHYKFNFYDHEELVSIIKIEIGKLIEIYNQEIESYHKFCQRLPEDAPRHIEFRRIGELRKKLLEALKEQVDLDFGDNTDYISSFSMKIARMNDFTSIHCRKCEREYFKEDLHYENLINGSGLAATGGRSVFCPYNHFVCGFLDWIS